VYFVRDKESCRCLCAFSCAASSYEPYGHVLIIAPWNYPFQLALCPLVAAVAAGNRVTLKPSANSNTSQIISKIVSETFSTDDVTVKTGDATVAAALLEQRWDYIFFWKCGSW
jgi:aldehyde dehydrogenase (NAD+)